MPDNIPKYDPKAYWENKLKQNYNLRGTGCLNLGTHYNNWLYKIKRKAFKRAINHLNLDIATKDILDIGSGTGFYIKEWKRLRSRTIVGIDITNVAIENLKKQFPSEKFYLADIGDTVTILGQQKYNIVSAIDVLFHIVDDGRFNMAIENIYDLLKHDGIFIFSDSFVHTTNYMKIPHHINRSLSHIEGILRKTGFQIIKRIPQSVIMHEPLDSENHFLRLFWLAKVVLIQKSELFGFLLGGLEYPLELVLISLLKESPASEIMICKKI